MTMEMRETMEQLTGAPARVEKPRETIRIGVDDPRWLSFIQQQPDCTIFHHPGWSSLLSECYGYRPFVIAVENASGEVLAGLPMMEVRSWLTGNRWVSLPFTDYCPPLSVDQRALGALSEYLLQLSERDEIPRVEVRWPLPPCAGLQTVCDNVLHTLRLSEDPEAAFRSFKKTQVQQRVMKAQREGVQICRCDACEDMQVYFQLHVHTRRRLGVPAQPRRFFELVWEKFIKRKLGFILLAYKGATPIAGAVFLTFNGTVTYKYSASDPDYWALRPNNLILWTAIRWGCENGYKIFDWGRTESSNQSLRSFKDGWGTTEHPLPYTFIGENSVPRRDRLQERLLTQVIQRSPSFVCRTLGEVFYKHVG